MSIKIQCPQCREKYNAGNEYLGRHFRCKCDAIIGVPDWDEILGAPAAENTASAPATFSEEMPGEQTCVRTRMTLYGYIALICGTSGILSAAAGLVFAVAACISPILPSPQENAYVSAGGLIIFLIAFLFAAVFRLADTTLRRNGLKYFF